MEKRVKEYISALKENKYFAQAVTLTKEKLNIFRKSKYFIASLTVSICLVVAIVMFVTIKSTTEANKYKTSIATNVAEEDFYNKKYDEAIAEYNKLQEKDEWPIWDVKIADIYSVKGEFIKSNEILRKAYEARNKFIDSNKEKKDKLKDKDIELANYIVFTTVMNGEYKKAVEYGEVFLHDYPDNKNLLQTMFTAYLVNGDKNKAKDIVDSYPRTDEGAVDLAILARMNMLIDNYDEGFTLLKDAWYKDKDEIKVFDVIAQIADYNENDILDKISKLEKKDPDELAYKMWTAKIYSMSKESAKKADQLIGKIESEDVGNENLMLIKANMYQNLGETEEAKTVLDELIKKYPNSFIGYHASAWQAYNNENYDEAFKDSEKSIVANRDYPDNYGFLIPEIMEKQDKIDGIEPYFRTALHKEPLNYNIIIKTAEYYGNATKDTSKAMRYYELASKINPNDAEVYYNMALIQINNQRQDDAIPLLKKSISINDKLPKYHRALGTVYLNKESNEQSLKEIRSAYAIDKNDILTLNNAGCYYIAVDGDLTRGMVNLKAAYDGINEKTSEEDKETITENYNRIRNLSDAYNKRNGATLKVPDLKLFY